MNNMTPASVADQEHLITTPKDLRGTLDEHGVAIIPSVLDATEIDEMKEGFWTMLGQLTANLDRPVKRSARSTWKNYYALSPMRGQLLQHFGVGQAQVLWNLRQNPKIVDIFATLWNDPDLLVSFDGASFAFPHEVTKKKGEYEPDKEMYHIDQRPGEPEFQCVQSWVTAYDVNPGDATLSILEGSHKLMGDFAQEFGYTELDKSFVPLKDHELSWYVNWGCTPRDIICPAGSMVFWDSRTIHYGKGAIEGRKQPNFRAVAYLCYTPRKMATEEDLQLKRRAFLQNKTTSHCPHAPRPFPDKPKRRFDKSVVTGGRVQIPPPVLTPLGRRLAGFDDDVDGEE